MNDIELIIFDIDGTLAETDSFYVDKAASILRYPLFFIPRTAVNYIARQLIMSGETVVHLFYRFLDLLGIDAFIHSLHNAISQHESKYKFVPVKGMQQTIRELSVHYHLAIVTSGGEKSTSAFLKAYDLHGLFDMVLTAENCDKIKPSGKPLKIIASKCGINPQHCVMVGDTIYDVISAHRAHMHSVGVLTGFDHRWLLKLFNPDLILDSVVNLPAALETDSESQPSPSSETPSTVQSVFHTPVQ